MIYKLKTKSSFFLVPVGRPIRNNAEYFSSEKKTFTGGRLPVTCYRIGTTWYKEECFDKIELIKNK